ncbi:MAG: translesion error-prone DNA polymerase V autoproteolytic subunit [Rickettsiales bacterium]|nr:translesion error-prone DNA polymerase V autoproteolytic subunit [Rickettsiales bacterium]
MSKKIHGGKRKGAGRKAGSNKFGEPTLRMRIPESAKPTVDKILEHVIEMNKPQPSNIELVTPAIARTAVSRPLFSSRVPAGFPSPADDYVELHLDLNEYVDADNPAVFYCWVVGESMTGAGIFDGDLLVVDKSLEAKHNDVVVAVVNNELTVKRLYKRGGEISLHPENPNFPVITFSGDMELTIWGVVSNVTRKLRRSETNRPS